MPHKNPTITTLRQLLRSNCLMMSDTERQLKENIPLWIEKTDSEKLKSTLTKYLYFISLHLNRLDSIFIDDTSKAGPVSCRTIETMLTETNEHLGLCADKEVWNASLIANVQLFNHYKISAYGTLAAFATRLGDTDAVTFFREAEVNEKHIDDRLSQLAEFEINPKAQAPLVL
jgi:ferritin-like metal-binding protein YciE